LANLGHRVSDTALANIFKAHGIEPAPERRSRSTWKSFLAEHWHVLASVDFTTVEERLICGSPSFFTLRDADFLAWEAAGRLFDGID
jgi:putative transposase